MIELSQEQRIDRGARAKRALDEFIDPAFEVVAEEYLRKITALCASRPWASNEIAALANARRVVEEVRAQIVELVTDGEIAKDRKGRADAIAKLSPAKRRLLNIGAI